jgi:hypothetical protein
MIGSQLPTSSERFAASQNSAFSPCSAVAALRSFDTRQGAVYGSPVGMNVERVTWRVAEQVNIETAVSDQLIFGRVIDVQTGDVESVAQVVLPRNQEVDSLLS